MTTREIENNVQQAINAVLQNNNPSPPENNEYRFYHCHLDWNGLKCTKVNGPGATLMRNDSLLLSVKSYIPERFDKEVLKYKWMPSNVMIEKST